MENIITSHPFSIFFMHTTINWTQNLTNKINRERRSCKSSLLNKRTYYSEFAGNSSNNKNAQTMNKQIHTNLWYKQLCINEIEIYMHRKWSIPNYAGFWEPFLPINDLWMWGITPVEKYIQKCEIKFSILRITRVWR